MSSTRGCQRNWRSLLVSAASGSTCLPRCLTAWKCRYASNNDYWYLFWYCPGDDSLSMKFNIETRGDITVIKLQGARLDANTSRELKKLVEERAMKRQDKVILDFESVKFLDSSGLGVLVSIMKFLRAPGALVICQINDRTIQDILRLTRMDQVFTITETREKALQLFSQ
ncbi:MAG: anti-sigma factor antagonist [Gammaproteobacteria bacterium]|nr:MAG: anti-sigma factor antagonist [Gammaproteobacteria bacterium]